jgi:hypothetical protein
MDRVGFEPTTSASLKASIFLSKGRAAMKGEVYYANPPAQFCMLHSPYVKRSFDNIELVFQFFPTMQITSLSKFTLP